MSAYGSTSLGTSQRGPDLQDVRFPGVREYLTSPGVTPLPGVSRAAQELEQVMGIISQAGQTARAGASYVGQLNEEQRIAAAKAERDAEKAARRQEDYDRGQAALYANPIVAALGAEFRDPAKPLPADLLEYAKQVTERETQGASEAYKDQYLKSVVSGLSQEFEARRTADANATRQDVNAKLTARLLSDPSSSSEVRATSAHNNGPFEYDQAAPFIDAANTAAKLGLDSFPALIKNLDGPAFEKQRAIFENEYKTVKAQQANDVKAKAYSDIGDLRVASVQSGNFAPVLDAIQKFRASNAIDGAAAASLDKSIRDEQQSYVTKTINDAQEALRSSLESRVYFRDWASPESFVKELDDRLRNHTNPNDPEYINPAHAMILRNSVIGAKERDYRTERIRQDANAIYSGGAVLPATPQDDHSLLQVMGERGAVRMNGVGDKSVYDSITNPVAFARLASAFQRVPAEIEKRIGTGMASPDQSQVLAAATTYAAIYRQDPQLAMGLDMPGIGKARAHLIADRIDLLGPAAVADPQRIESAVSTVVSQAVRLDDKIMSLPKSEVEGVIFKGNQNYARDNKESANDFRTAAYKVFSGAIRETNEGAAAGLLTPGKLLFNKKYDVPDESKFPSEVVDTFQSKFVDEYRYARSVIPIEKDAVASAQKQAMSATIAEHPPYTWNGQLYFGRRGDPVVSEEQFRTAITDAMETNPAPGSTADGRKEAMQTLFEDYVPVWTPGQGENRRGAFVFHNRNDPSRIWPTALDLSAIQSKPPVPPAEPRLK